MKIKVEIEKNSQVVQTVYFDNQQDVDNFKDMLSNTKAWGDVGEYSVIETDVTAAQDAIEAEEAADVANAELIRSYYDLFDSNSASAAQVQKAISILIKQLAKAKGVW